ncbi:MULTISPECIES: exodeoxyribonuclease V subunit beta [Gammaproteobacteria]|uniref:exodeoxyribonuclease V subunit beta n=1 Tax=Gammaproteobacteria TaxID=1236 RepID=UPI000DCFD101|nr:MULTISPECIES: exodeoxyribonuclease V subunit beta [Gammaproteobacteria]RTE85842.1 exodeoxyribonuclease V subunit beta [Aliidiomarina sp. B3213]TCZ90157.1 exodeoxyribonuclease V subunit beta [Lysobacter sp. N42]
MSHTLHNPLNFPLHGSRLIEASAGTGKTYTIAALYVRLIIQHGTEQTQFERELVPKDILVMTFTNAATAELSDRIRARLTETAEFFRDSESAHNDKFLQDLKADCLQQGLNLVALARKLELAAQSMDESAVHTINGWSQKMLTEHAFASGSLFQQTVQTEEDELRVAAAEDYFRSHVYRIDDLYAAQEVSKYLGSPAEFVRFGKLQASNEEDASVQLKFETLLNKIKQIPDRRQRYRRVLSELLPLVHDFPAKGFSNYVGIIQKLRQFVEGTLKKDEMGANIKLLDPEGIRKKFKKGFDENKVPEHVNDLTSLPDDVHDIQETKNAYKKIIEGHARHFIAKRFKALKQQQAIMGFDDMLTGLRDALRGPNGDALAKTIRSQFPIALVDEFQDTDPVQYEIFDRVYNIENTPTSNGIFLIGDPKQAIYSFRDADIFTYLKARKATSGRHYTLGTNFRSSESMVNAINELFQRAEESARGAFLYKSEIPFQSVKANGQKAVFKGLDGKESAALQWTVEPERAANKSDFQGPASEYHANLIAKLLESDTAGFYVGSERTPVTSKDIAVLVANAKEANLIRKQLAKRGVRSVYLSERDAVYSQPVAQDLLSIVKACAQPRDPSRIRTALSTALLDLPLADLVMYQENESRWEEAVDRFIGYHDIWEHQGVLAALHKLLHDFEVPKCLLAEPQEGERILSDALHICELLQKESLLHEGMAGLEEYFTLQVSEYKSTSDFAGASTKSTQNDALKLRLESDQELVKVITYHKSKGLQYPLVFMPFAAYTAERRFRIDTKLPMSYHDIDENGERVRKVAWDNSDAHAIELIEQEQLAENLRKMYVALTRAEFATFVTLQVVGEARSNPLFYLLLGDDVHTAEKCDLMTIAQERWQSTGEVPNSSVMQLPSEERVSVSLARANHKNLSAWTMPEDHQFERWWVASYSALKYGSELLAPQTPPEMNTLDEREDDDDALVGASTDLDAEVSASRIHHLPKGAGPGTFLHNLLEDAAEVGFAEIVESQEARDELLNKRCRSKFWQAYKEDLAAWLVSYLQQPFPYGSTDGTANAVSAHFVMEKLPTYKAEPEFWFAARNVSTEYIDALVAQHIMPDQERPKLDPKELNGMLKGFIDLVFEHNGKYFVADYKSNWLGETDEDYSFENMRKKILSSRYDLQYVIYTLALHKLLKARLGEAYDYDEHIGGAVYLFLRGHKSKTAGAFYDRPPKALIEALEALFDGEAVNANGGAYA